MVEQFDINNTNPKIVNPEESYPRVRFLLVQYNALVRELQFGEFIHGNLGERVLNCLDELLAHMEAFPVAFNKMKIENLIGVKNEIKKSYEGDFSPADRIVQREKMNNLVEKLKPATDAWSYLFLGDILNTSNRGRELKEKDKIGIIKNVITYFKQKGEECDLQEVKMIAEKLEEYDYSEVASRGRIGRIGDMNYVVDCAPNHVFPSRMVIYSTRGIYRLENVDDSTLEYSQILFDGSRPELLSISMPIKCGAKEEVKYQCGERAPIKYTYKNIADPCIWVGATEHHYWVKENIWTTEYNAKPTHVVYDGIKYIRNQSNRYVPEKTPDIPDKERIEKTVF